MWCLLVLFVLAGTTSAYGNEYLTVDQIQEKMESIGKVLNGLKKEGLSFSQRLIGESYQKSPMIAYCFGSCTRPSFSMLLMGGIHGREGSSVMSTLTFISSIVDKITQGDEEVEIYLGERSLWIIPCMNPDTYDMNLRSAKVMKGGRKIYGLRRKSQHPVCDDKKRRFQYDEDGVDLNRNFPVCFDIDEKGSSSRACGEDYRGAYALSEPETQSLNAFIETSNFTFSLAISLHSYGRSVLHPYSCKSLASSMNDSTLTLFTISINDILRGVETAKQYSTGLAWNVPGLYSVNGDLVDYLYNRFAIPAFSIELPPEYPQHNSMKGFWPDLSLHWKETDQLLWNSLMMSGCNLVLENQFLKNRGFGVCTDLLVRVESGKEEYEIRRLGMYEVAQIKHKRKHSVQVTRWNKGVAILPSSHASGRDNSKSVLGIQWEFVWNTTLNKYSRSVRRVEAEVQTGKTHQPHTTQITTQTTTHLPGGQGSKRETERRATPPTTLSHSTNGKESGNGEEAKGSSDQHGVQEQANISSRKDARSGERLSFSKRVVPVGYVMKMYSPRRELVIPWIIGVFVVTWLVIIYLSISVMKCCNRR